MPLAIQSSPFSPDMVKKVQDDIKGMKGFYQPVDLLKAHLMEK
ncbi:hypothetical protein [Algoriphagus ratkowskyi]|nr:hypothetical protein [Algoriphagus ratkowskyi]